MTAPAVTPIPRAVMEAFERYDRKLLEYETGLRRMEEAQSARLMETFGIFIAIFSALIVGGNTALQVATTKTPQEAFWFVLAVMVPFLLVVLVLLGAIALVTRRRHVRQDG